MPNFSSIASRASKDATSLEHYSKHNLRMESPDIDEFENAIVQQLAASSTGCAPWRKSEIEQEGCREGAQMAALEFYWVHRREVRNVVLKELRPAECDQTNVQ